MKISFLGAAQEVTGSCHCIEANGKRILLDCGLQQGFDMKNNQKLPFSSKSVDYIFITHAHIDHSGRIPLLVKEGFNGKIYATRATCDLLKIMLKDSGHIQEAEAMWRQRKGRRAGVSPTEPLYTIADAEESLKYLVPCEYDEEINIYDGIKAIFTDAGHLLGSASVQLKLDENGERKSLAFSGDIGNFNHPIIKNPKYLEKTDYVIMESTYGNKYHKNVGGDYAADLAKIIDNTLRNGGNVVFPSFAVGRTQELLYYMREIKERGLVASNPNFEVYLDSPLALEATQIFNKMVRSYANKETLDIINRGDDPLRFHGLKLCPTMEESRALNEDYAPKVIISSSGMCEAGRIRHHLKHNLWRRECSVVFTGFQARGTLGRMLLDGVRTIKLFGEEVSVVAEIHNFKGLSAHADKNGLLVWINSFKEKPKKVFVVHGEKKTAKEFAASLQEIDFDAIAPNFMSEYDCSIEEFSTKGIEMVERTEVRSPKRPSTVYHRLLLAGERLLEVIRQNESSTNKDLGRFADQIISLSDKWND